MKYDVDEVKIFNAMLTMGPFKSAEKMLNLLPGKMMITIQLHFVFNVNSDQKKAYTHMRKRKYIIYIYKQI